MVKHLYIHVPFCAKICPFCAFYVHRGGVEQQREFVAALKWEIEQAQQIYSFNLESIYFGGGTPSLLSAELFNEITYVLPKSGGIEFTLEVNPATVDDRKIAAWKAAGVNRISLGAQSFDQTELQLLGRQHSPADISETISLLRSADFSNINLDLLFAVPNQDEKKWTKNLEAALACNPDHLSAYALTYEEDTPFFQAKMEGKFEVDEEREIRMFESTVEILTQAGFPPYEISNYARPGYESRHNQAYWEGADYLGVGPSAVSTIGNQRWKNIANTRDYIARCSAQSSLKIELENLSEETKNKEKLMFGLRTRKGIPSETISSEMRSRLLEEGLILEEENRVRLTSRGRLVADSIAALFV